MRTLTALAKVIFTVIATPALLLHAGTEVEGSKTRKLNTSLESGYLKLTIVDAESGNPVPLVRIDYRRWEGGKFEGRTLQADPSGVCEVRFPTETTTDLELTTRMNDFADTHLSWRMDRGEQIPASYTLRLIRPVPIGGKVVDADGRPVAGAKVGWNNETNVMDSKFEARPESHAFSWIEVETNPEGRWRINRMAPEMIHRIYGSARHPEHVDTTLLFTAEDHEAEKQLRDETHVFRLGRAASIRGTVVDPEGKPVIGAKILLGQLGMSDRRETKTDSTGAFDLPGSPPGRNLLSAAAKGFATTTMEVDVTADAKPFQLSLHRGRLLRLRMVDQADRPVPKAWIGLNTMDYRSRPGGHPSSPAPVQAEFQSRTDAEGRLTWTDAPATEMSFSVMAHGFMHVNADNIQADGKEHVIKLPPALVISGTVRDAATGKPLPHFRIGTGWPAATPEDATAVHWSPLDRHWMSFAGGKFRHSYEESIVSGIENPGYVLKFEVEGYTPFVSRVIRPDEGEVTLDVALKQAQK